MTTEEIGVMADLARYSFDHKQELGPHAQDRIVQCLDELYYLRRLLDKRQEKGKNNG